VALICAVVAVPAAATVIVKQTMEELAQSSDVVVRGKVLRAEAQWDEAHRAIWTLAEIQVTDTLKGSARGIIVVRSPGGSAGEITQTIAGAPRFAAGEELVLFLFQPPDDPKSFGVQGLSAGKVALQNHFGRLTARRDMRGLTELAPGKREPAPIDAIENLGPADAFLARIRAAVREAKK